MPLIRLLVSAFGLACGAPAAAGVTVYGTSSARLCYEAAELGAGNSAGVEHCDRALAEEALIREERVATFVNRGILKLRGGRVDASIADFDEAMSIDPSEPEAHLNKAMALLRLPGRSDEAITLFGAALSHKTSRPALAHYGRAIAHEAAGRMTAAWRDYRQASLLEPEWRDPKTELARFTVSRR